MSTDSCAVRNQMYETKQILTGITESHASGCNDFHITVKSFTGCKHNTAYRIISYMLCNLHDTFFVTILYFQSVSDCRQFFVFK